MKYLYQAMTAAEWASAPELPRHPGWMACHFSPYGLGLSNLPKDLPEGALIMVSDRIAPAGHDAQVVVSELKGLVERFRPVAIVLDLERKDDGFYMDLARKCCEIPAAEVVVPAPYGKDLPCSIFLGAAELWTPADEWLRPWEGRRIWAESVLQRGLVRIDPNGAVYRELPWQPPEERLQLDEDLQVVYEIREKEDSVEVMLWRGKKELEGWQKMAEALGTEHFLGLYQQSI